MTVQGQSGRGHIEVFSDFCGPEIAVAGTVAGPVNFFPFVMFGNGVDTNDSGVVTQTTLLGGVVRLTSSATDNLYCKVGTSPMFDVALMGPLILEARVQRFTLTGGRVFIGFSNGGDTTSAVECEANAGTVTNTLSNFAGFLWDSGASLSTKWLYCYNGGTTAALTTEQDTGKTITAGEWDTLRIVINSDGSAEWYVNGEYIIKISGAISTTTDINGYVAVGSTTGATSLLDLDYLYIKASRDWTR